jgi:hypothetical protein
MKGRTLSKKGANSPSSWTRVMPPGDEEDADPDGEGDAGGGPEGQPLLAGAAAGGGHGVGLAEVNCLIVRVHRRGA